MADRLRAALIKDIIEAARPKIEEDMQSFDDLLLFGDPRHPYPSRYPALNKMLLSR